VQIDTLFRIDQNATTIKNHFMVESFSLLHHTLTFMVFQHLHLNKASRAKYNAHADMSTATRSRCASGTRLEVITYIEQWANDYSENCPSIFWLSGLAGTGKSTIAYTLCEMFESKEAPESSTTLGASFFCSRQMEETRNTRFIIPTIVYQLSQVSASFNRFLHNSGWDSVDVLSFRTQERLVDPWVQSAHERSPDSATLIVIDALEESDGGCDFLRMLLSHTHKLPGLKFLISSRPNPNIASQLTSREDVITFQLHTDIDSAEVEQDIRSYLSAELPGIAEDEVISEIAQQSGGLFIYAATAVKLGKPPRQQLSKREQLQQLQKLRHTWPCDPGSRSLGLPVDDIYRQALREAFANCPDDVRETRLNILHTILCTRARLTCQCVAELLDIDVETVQVTVDSLFAVLFILPADGAVYWYHASFPEFMFNSKRSSGRIGSEKENDSNDATWFCDASRLHYSLSLRCFHIMQTKLRFNMCQLPSSYFLDSEVKDLRERIHENIDPTLQYCCRYGVDHILLRVEAVRWDALAEYIHDFLFNRLLYWVEAMNLLGIGSQCHVLLLRVRQAAIKVSCSPILSIFDSQMLMDNS
jgi:hypothetical protein